MTDPFAEGPIHEQGDGAPFVIRLSRTATGSLTYTIGASFSTRVTPESVVDSLFLLRDLVEARITAPAQPRKAGSLAADLRHSLILTILEGPKNTPPTWLTTTQVTEGVKGHRSQVVADLKTLVTAGLVEYKAGKGGSYPSTYRLKAVRK